MRHYWTRPGSEQPIELALFGATVVGMPDVQHIESWGSVEGAIADDDGQIVFLVVGLALRGSPRRRVVIPLDAVEITYTGFAERRKPLVRVYWTLQELEAQPTFIEGRLPDTTKSSTPVTGRWRSIPSTRTPMVAAPPAPARRAMGQRRAMVWGILAGVAGLLIGVAFRDVRSAAILTAAFAVVGAVVGFLVGYSRESDDDANDDVPSRPSTVCPEIELLESAFRNYDFLRRNGVRVTRIRTPVVGARPVARSFLGSGAQARHA